MQVQTISSADELRKLVNDELEFVYDCGYTKPTFRLELSDRELLVRSVWLHYIYFLPHAELVQLKKGLCETLELDTLISLHPHEIRSCLVASKHFDITSDYLLEAFAIQYSEQGSNKRTTEEAIILHWTDYIMECSGKPL